MTSALSKASDRGPRKSYKSNEGWNFPLEA
jgi:hypothetical protein